MPLLNIRYGQTKPESLGRENVFGPIGEASAINRAVNEVNSAAQGMYAKHIELRQESIDLETQKEISQWELRNKAKPFFTTDELPDDLEFDKTVTTVDEVGNKTETPRTQIPAYEVYPQLFYRKAKATIEAQAERMPNEKIRQKWQTAQMAVLDSSHAQALKEANEKLAAYQEKRAVLNVEEAVESGNYILARELTKSIKDPLVQQDVANKVNIAYETSDYDEALRTDDVQMLIGSLEFLNMENYHEVGYLDEHARRTWADQIKSRLYQLSNREKSVDKASLELLKRDIRAINEAHLRGDKVDPNTEAKIIENAKGYYDQSGIPSLIADNQLTRTFRTELYPLMTVPYHLRYDMIRSLKGQATDPHILKMLDHAEKMSEQAFELWKTDPMKYARNYGIISEKDYTPLDYRDLGGSLAKRIEVAQRVEDATGYTKGFLTQGEATQLARAIMDKPPGQQIPFLKEIAAGLGDKTASLYDQLRDAGLKGSYAVAGVAAYQNDFQAAETLLRGGRRLEDRNITWIKKGLNDELNVFMAERLNKTYPESEARRSLAAHALRAAYVSQMELTDIEDDELDKTKAIIALDIATGGLVQWGGSFVQPPRRYYGQDAWEGYIKSLHHSELINMNDGATPVHYTTQELMKLVKSKDIQFIDRNPLGGDGYIMVRGGQAILGSHGKEYLFKHRDDPITVEAVRTKRMAEAVADGKIKVHDWGYSPGQLRDMIYRFKKE